MAADTNHDPRDLEELLDQLDKAAHTQHQQFTMEDVISAVGKRSFAPLLLLVGALITSPLSGIPSMPTLTGLIVLLVSIQLLLGRHHFWLPAWLLKRHIPRTKLIRAIAWLRPPARVVDRVIKPRLTILVRGKAIMFIASLCLILAFGMPMLELIPFSSSIAGVALAAFGLALISNDGLLALLAYIATGTTFLLAIYGLFL